MSRLRPSGNVLSKFIGIIDKTPTAANELWMEPLKNSAELLRVNEEIAKLSGRIMALRAELTRFHAESSPGSHAPDTEALYLELVRRKEEAEKEYARLEAECEFSGAASMECPVKLQLSQAVGKAICEVAELTEKRDLARATASQEASRLMAEIAEARLRGREAAKAFREHVQSHGC